MATNAKSVHRKRPPCSCDSCLRATAQADQRKAEIEAILARLEAAERLAKEAE
jgi:hypothetical protein